MRQFAVDVGWNLVRAITFWSLVALLAGHPTIYAILRGY